MVNWLCASALCFNKSKTRYLRGQQIKYYRLPRSERTQQMYMKLFTSGMNWKGAYLWGTLEWRERKCRSFTGYHNYYQSIWKNKNNPSLKKQLNCIKNPSEKIKLIRYKTAKRKFEIATQIKNSAPQPIRNHAQWDNSVPIVYQKKALSKKGLQKKLDATVSPKWLMRKLNLKKPTKKSKF